MSLFTLDWYNSVRLYSIDYSMSKETILSFKKNSVSIYGCIIFQSPGKRIRSSLNEYSSSRNGKNCSSYNISNKIVNYVTVWKILFFDQCGTTRLKKKTIFKPLHRQVILQVNKKRVLSLLFRRENEIRKDYVPCEIREIIFFCILKWVHFYFKS